MGEPTFSHDWEDSITCPHCGNVDEESYELDDVGETECNACGEPFSYERHTMIRYSTEKLEPPPTPTSGADDRRRVWRTAGNTWGTYGVDRTRPRFGSWRDMVDIAMSFAATIPTPEPT